MDKKQVMGQGLDALFAQVSPDENSKKEQVSLVNLDDIDSNPNQPRKKFDDESLLELADSIKEKGVLQPILLQKQGTKRYLIIVGERRYRASKLLKLATIPALVREFTDLERNEVALIENLQRDDLNVIEEALAYQYLLTKAGIRQEELAKRVGKKRSTISNSIRLLKLAHNAQEALINREISAGHARALLSVENSEEQDELLELIIGNKLSVREAEKLSQELLKNETLKLEATAMDLSSNSNNTHTKFIQQKLTGFLEQPVKLQQKGLGFRIQIDLESSADLDSLLTKLNIE